MTRIVVNPGELAETASLLRSVSGEYETIGTRVASCDCGCMPADVAATVDASVGAIHARLRETSGVVAAYAAELDRRASVPQDGGFTAVGSAFGSGASFGGAGSFVVGGTGADASFSSGSGGGGFAVGGTGFDQPFFGTGGGVFVVGGTGFDPSFSSGSGGGGGVAIVGGAGPPLPSAGGGGGGVAIVGGGSGFDTGLLGTGGGGGTAVVGGADSQWTAAMQASSIDWNAIFAGAARAPGLLPILIGNIERGSGIWAPGVM